mmetsp:Transcript_26638/g.76950  ORF Transcript_26638/g.76950 Transcript_26638/m.76950 type:complete len:201 (-) Transcript_26638:7-609(-)
MLVTAGGSNKPLNLFEPKGGLGHLLALHLTVEDFLAHGHMLSHPFDAAEERCRDIPRRIQRHGQSRADLRQGVDVVRNVVPVVGARRHRHEVHGHVGVRRGPQARKSAHELPVPLGAHVRLEPRGLGHLDLQQARHARCLHRLGTQCLAKRWEHQLQDKHRGKQSRDKRRRVAGRQASACHPIESTVQLAGRPGSCVGWP